jgi:hypothetical protein
VLRFSALTLLLSAGLVTTTAQGALLIDINYSGDPLYQNDFTTAASTWQSLLTGFQNGVVVARSSGSSYTVGQTVSTVFINASISAIDGAGGTLGSAGPNQIVQDAANFFLATDGGMNFDSADWAALTPQQRQALILHEMAHVLGFGTMWTLNGVYTNGSGEYTGTHATAAWQSEFGQSGTPDVELGGGAGTANGHWNEVDGGGGLTGIVDGQGRDLRDELMTGWLNSNSFISNMTIASFRDIGFTATADTPEPGTMVLLSFGLAVLGIAKRRRV